MKDKNGFLIKCEWSEWRCVDDFWNHEYVCCQNGYKCIADENCPHYKPERSEDEKD